MSESESESRTNGVWYSWKHITWNKLAARLTVLAIAVGVVMWFAKLRHDLDAVKERTELIRSFVVEQYVRDEGRVNKEGGIHLFRWPE